MTLRAALIVAVVLTFVGCDTPDPGDGTGATDGADATDATDGASSTTDYLPADAACERRNAAYARARGCDDGIQYCVHNNYEEKYFWGPCSDEFVCEPGETDDCRECRLGDDGVPTWWDSCGETTTPLVLSFGDGPVRYDSSSATFDLGPRCGATDWPHATTPWLALDRDGSGAIEAGRELFGSATVLRHGALADNGFHALAELDHDRDGRITAADPDFARLLLWADHDADRRSTAWELTPVASAGIIAIGLTYRHDARCDGRSNCEIERAAFTYRDALGHERVGEIIDVHLACQ